MSHEIDYQQLAQAIQTADDDAVDAEMQTPGWSDYLRGQVPARGTTSGAKRLEVVHGLRADVEAQSQRDALRAKHEAEAKERAEATDARNAVIRQYEIDFAAWEGEARIARLAGRVVPNPPTHPDAPARSSTPAVPLTAQQAGYSM